jgi:hypothetical protein
MFGIFLFIYRTNHFLISYVYLRKRVIDTSGVVENYKRPITCSLTDERPLEILTRICRSPEIPLLSSSRDFQMFP